MRVRALFQASLALYVVCLGDAALARDSVRAIPKIAARAAIVVDPRDGSFLYEKHADEKRAVASTQKLLTALIASEAGDLEKAIKVEATDTRVEPSKVGIRAGAEYPKKLLIQGLLVKSGNDVARCLARDHAGGQDAFEPVLNAKARQLGMGDSHFVNAHGLTAEGQESTARDMSKLAIAAYRDEVIREAVQMKELEFPMKTWTEKLPNSNQLLSLPFVTGMKTGFTDAAGRCLVSSGNYEGREVIVVVLGSDSKHVWADSEALLRWALRVPDEVEAPGETDDVGESESSS